MSQPAHWKAKAHRAEYDEMRERLLTAAWDLACEQGVKRLTLNGVAARADCARSSVYRYFDTREQLLGEALNHRLYVFGQELDAELRHYTDPGEQMVQGLWLTVCAVKQGPSLAAFRLPVGEESDELMGVLQGQVPLLASDLFDIDPIFKRARAEGRVRENLSDDEILQWLITLGLGLLQQPAFGGDRERETAYLRKLLVPSIFVH